MDVKYKKDLHHNYLVLPKADKSDQEAYSVTMLEANSIDGIIRPEPRNIDNQVLYYYDITSKQSMGTIYIKSTITYEELKQLFIRLAEIIEQAYEYLLNENDLILEPEHIYMELEFHKASICYLPGYNKDIGKQIATLVEYLMNKVDYNDKEAVLYVYNLYAVCRDDGFSFSNLLSVIRESHKKEDSVKEEQKVSKQIPVMMEKVSHESEVYYYSLRTYLYTGACIAGAIMVILICHNMNIIYTSIGNRIDYGKLLALLLILAIIIGFLMKGIWNKDNRLTRIISKDEYIDPRNEYEPRLQAEIKSDHTNKEYEYTLHKSKLEATGEQDDRIDATVLLNATEQYNECCLEPEDKGNYDAIGIREFPFLIGKQKTNVDYFLDKEVISRYHLKITKEENSYYITDLNSTNGTTLNNKPLSCYQRYKIFNDDKVSIAGINYIFQL